MFNTYYLFYINTNNYNAELTLRHNKQFFTKPKTMNEKLCDHLLHFSLYVEIFE